MQDAMSPSKIKHPTNTSPNLNGLTHIVVSPKSWEWKQFLILSVDYLCETWSEVLEKGETKESLLKTYEQQLLHRIGEGGRILLVWKLGDIPVRSYAPNA